MKRLRLFIAPLVLAGVFFALWRVDAAQASREQESRDAMRRLIGRLIPQEERDRMHVVALTVEMPPQGRWLYAKVGGRWRCLDRFRAPADADAIEGLFKSLLEAEGVEQSHDPARLADYGFAPDHAVRLLLHGPKVLVDADRDVQFRVELGKRLEDLDGGYVRRAGSSAVWSIDTDPLAVLQAPRPEGEPPLLDRNVIVHGWPGEGRRLKRIEVERAGERFELLLEDKPASAMTEEAQRRGEPSWTWKLKRGDATEDAQQDVVGSWVALLFQMPWAKVLDPKTTEQAGLKSPAARVVLHCDSGDPLQLVLSAPKENGALAIANLETEALYELAPDVGPLAAPRLADVLPAAANNPWRTYMEARQKAQAARQPAQDGH